MINATTPLCSWSNFNLPASYFFQTQPIAIGLHHCYLLSLPRSLSQAPAIAPRPFESICTSLFPSLSLSMPSLVLNTLWLQSLLALPPSRHPYQTRTPAVSRSSCCLGATPAPPFAAHSRATPRLLRSGVCCDIVPAAEVAVENSALLAAYCRNHPMCRQLLLLVKLWAKRRSLTQARLPCHITDDVQLVMMMTTIPNEFHEDEDEDDFDKDTIVGVR